MAFNPEGLYQTLYNYLSYKAPPETERSPQPVRVVNWTDDEQHFIGLDWARRPGADLVFTKPRRSGFAAFMNEYTNVATETNSARSFLEVAHEVDRKLRAQLEEARILQEGRLLGRRSDIVVIDEAESPKSPFSSTPMLCAFGGNGAAIQRQEQPERRAAPEPSASPGGYETWREMNPRPTARDLENASRLFRHNAREDERRGYSDHTRWVMALGILQELINMMETHATTRSYHDRTVVRPQMVSASIDPHNRPMLAAGHREIPLTQTACAMSMRLLVDLMNSMPAWPDAQDHPEGRKRFEEVWSMALMFGEMLL